MLEFLFFTLLVGILLFVFSRTVRLWVIAKVVEYIFGRVARQAEANQRAQQDRGQRQSSSSSSRPSHDSRQKQDLNDIEARGFDKKNSDEYVDFEEIK